MRLSCNLKPAYYHRLELHTSRNHQENVFHRSALSGRSGIAAQTRLRNDDSTCFKPWRYIAPLIELNDLLKQRPEPAGLRETILKAHREK